MAAPNSWKRFYFDKIQSPSTISPNEKIKYDKEIKLVIDASGEAGTKLISIHF